MDRHFAFQESQCQAELEAVKKEFAEFASIVSHDLNAALRGSYSFSKLLKEHYETTLEGEAKLYLSHIMQSNQRAHAMLEGLLDYSRLNTHADPVSDDIDASQLVARCIENVKPTIAATNADIQVEHLPIVKANSKQLQRLLLCLLDNSLKFASSDQKPCIAINGSEIGKGWRFCVRDNGIGIAPKDGEEIFKPLKQLHQAGTYPGVGMGLAIARKIVRHHGGRIWVESEPGQGAAFWFTLAKSAGENKEVA